MPDTTGYWLTQGGRVAWYLSQYLMSTRVSRHGRARAGRAEPSAPTMRNLLVDLAKLLRQDRGNIRAGLYKMPHDALPDLPRWIGDTIRYFDDLPSVNARRERGAFGEVGSEYDTRPEYYRRTFHYQTDGYLSARSAALYDHQVEVLFLGGAAAMRRQALVPVSAYIRRRRVRTLTLLDLGSGTGTFLTFVKDNWPDTRVIAVDLSRHYLAEAEKRLRPWGGSDMVTAAAETLPLADASVDLITCIYLLHEVPDAARAGIAAEAARVLRPGGRVVVVDSLQYGDRPNYDVLLDKFPISFHEPFYASYAAADLDAVFERAGLRSSGSTVAFFSKIMVFDRPDA